MTPDLDRLTEQVTTTGGLIYLRPEHLIELMTVDELWEWLRANIFSEESA